MKMWNQLVFPNRIQIVNIIVIISCCWWTTYVNCIQIDNHLVTAQHDCFERIALGAMLPFDKTFRNSDTNSLKVCERLCLADKQCITFAFGISGRGNGTCQLSSEVIDGTRSRPFGTVFDPDFDLYARKTNCFQHPSAENAHNNNQIPKPGGLGNFPGSEMEKSPPPNRPGVSSFPPPDIDRPGPPIFGSSPVAGNSFPTTQFGIDVTSRPTSEYPTSPQTVDRTQFTNGSPRPSTPTLPSEEELYTTKDRQPPSTYPSTNHYYPSTEKYPNDRLPPSKENYPNKYPNNGKPSYGRPSSSSGAGGTSGSGDGNVGGGGGGGSASGGSSGGGGSPYDSSFPNTNKETRPSANRPYPNENRFPSNYDYDKPDDVNKKPIHSYPSGGPSGPARPSAGNNPNNYSPNLPHYPPPSAPNNYPILYEHNYPLPNDKDKFPNVYAQNVPILDQKYHRPSASNGGYGSGPSASGPGMGPSGYSNAGASPNPYHPTSTGLAGPSTGGGGSGYNGVGGGHTSSSGPGSNGGYPGSAPVTGGGGGGAGGGSNGYGGFSQPSGPIGTGAGYNQNIGRPLPMPPPPTGGSGYRPHPPMTIEEGGMKHYPSGNGGGGGGSGGYQVNEFHNDKFLNPLKPACFRRVLAGKRVSPNFVRRTLVCERVEDCQIECGEEKRFSCEGFNYRLDPSGRGQGDCELIEIPLAQIDLYSSPLNRDSNLIRHPDYDYYERDRSALNSCRQTSCIDCGSVKPYGPRPSAIDYFRPTTYRPAIDHYRPASYPGPSDPHSRPIGYGGGGGEPDRYRPQITAVDKYRPPIYESRPPDRFSAHHYSSSSSSSASLSSIENYRPSAYGGGGSSIDRYGETDEYYKPNPRPDYNDRPPTTHFGYPPQKPYQERPDVGPHDYMRPDDRPYSRPGPPSYHPDDESRPLPPPQSPLSSGGYRPSKPSGGGPPYSYSDRDHDHLNNNYQKPSHFVPYLIGQEGPQSSWGLYGGTYGYQSASHSSGGYGGGGYGSSPHSSNPPSGDYWGLKEHINRKDHHFNYFELGTNRPDDNSIWNYANSKPNAIGDKDYERDRVNFGSQWTRRPGVDECSVKSSEGFRLHKGVIRYAMNTPNVVDCERSCFSESRFKCHTFSYRYSSVSRENCLLCDRPYNLLDFYADLEPDRDYDIYSMSDDPKICKKEPNPERENNAQCFFRAVDNNRFFKAIVRDSLTVRSIGECELECIKSHKFTCRAFTFRYGTHTGNPIDNCQLSDWPVRDMDKDRHLVPDKTFDVFERASYGQGCEIQPITDEKHHKKFCYLGYGTPSKLLSSAIKKVVSVGSELECKNECIRFRESTSFKCLSFSFGSQASSFNCEMSDLDQTELKLGVHYAHSTDRDYWLFAWNPFDYTCRDKVTTIGGNRANNERRMDIFREPGDSTWRQFTVSGKPCRIGTKCDKNQITGFYSCEIEGGEIGSWDYCCKSEHPCGYSQGFDYPWCFVGDQPDQWRTCSDRYFPTKPLAGPTLSSTRYPTKKKDDLYHQAPPRPGGLQLQHLDDIPAAAKNWPVQFLYKEGPPNSTIISNVVDCKKDKC